MITTGMRANDRACHARQDVPGFIVITVVLKMVTLFCTKLVTKRLDIFFFLIVFDGAGSSTRRENTSSAKVVFWVRS